MSAHLVQEVALIILDKPLALAHLLLGQLEDSHHMLGKMIFMIKEIKVIILLLLQLE